VKSIVHLLERAQRELKEFHWLGLTPIELGDNPDSLPPQLPPTPGVYFISRGEQLLYVGQTGNLKERYKGSQRKDYSEGPNKGGVHPNCKVSKACAAGACQFRYIEIEKPLHRAVESLLIPALNPLWNNHGKKPL